MPDRTAPGGDPTGGWKVGQQVRFRPRLAFDTSLHRGTIVAIGERAAADGGAPVVEFTVQTDPADGAGRMQVNLAHLFPVPPENTAG